MRARGLPAGSSVTLDHRVRVWGDASVVLGGSPWGVIRIAAAGRDFVRRLRVAGAAGLAPSPGVEQLLADLLVARGVAHPVAGAPCPPDLDVDVVVPVYESPDLLDTCLSALRKVSPELRIIVVDDASTQAAVGETARAHGATVIRHPVNSGPAAARNTGLRQSNSAIVAFVDADCAVLPGWLEPLMAHFQDPRVVAVAPRIVPKAEGDGLLARYQSASSALDMGPDPELVTHGGPLGFLPSATVLVRRDRLGPSAFDETLRVGEDVDLIWRLIDDGRLVRYEPTALVSHAIRPGFRDWVTRIADYGTSAAELDRRHPGRLTPARLSGWSVAVAGLAVTRHPVAAAGVAALATGSLARTLRASTVDPRVAPVVIGRRLASDAAATGHLLRREWWPLGWLALALAPWSRAGRAGAAAMLIPIVREWVSRRPPVDPARYTALRLAEDAAYGSGVISGAVRSRRPAVLLPRVRLPRPLLGRRGRQPVRAE